MDIFTIGPAGTDTLVDVDDANVHCSIDKQLCELCLRYGDKIIAKGVVTKTAYNGMNSAIGSARLGLQTALYCVVGGDDAGSRIMRTLRQTKVSTRYIQVEPRRASNASVVINFHGERTILVHHGAETHFRFPAIPPRARWAYLTSFGGAWQPLYRSVERYLVKNPTTLLGFNPGSYQLRAGAKSLRGILKHTAVLFLNREEARLLTGVKKEKNELELLAAMRSLGAGVAVLTDGPVGSYASDGTNYYQLGIHPAPVIERTGCGDSFATGFIAALAYGETFPEAMRWGTLNAASVLQHIGPQDGLLSIAVLRRQARATRRSLVPKPL